jgi:hypothetical protein
MGSGEMTPLCSCMCGCMGGDLALLNWRVGGPLCSRPYCCSAGVLSNGRGGLLVFRSRVPVDGVVAQGSGVLERATSCSWMLPSSESLRPIPKSLRVARRRGLTGGRGGGLLSMPFFKEAPTGKSTVPTCDVEERSATGSEISYLLTVFLRRGTVRSGGPAGIGGGVGEVATGVFGPEMGGVGTCMYGEPRDEPPLARKEFEAIAAGDGPTGRPN